MSCEGCVKSVTRTLSSVSGVEGVNVVVGEAKVIYDPARTSVAELKKAVERAGFEAP